MEDREVINDILVNLFEEILEIEADAILKGEFKDISVNDMHILNAIGQGKGKNMSTIAEMRGVTIGSLSTSMNSLVKKGYVYRERSEEDRRVVIIKLTEKGDKAYEAHNEFHDMLTDAAMSSMTPEELPKVVKVLKKVAIFFREFRLKDNTEKQEKETCQTQ